MSSKSDLAKLDRVASLIGDVLGIVEHHGGISATLSDKEGQYAVLMCVSQIGVLLSMVESPELIQILPVRGSAALRNVIVHDYGVDLRIVAMTLEKSLPALREIIGSILTPPEERS